MARKQYKLGKYDILVQPALGAAHMMRYTVMLNGRPKKGAPRPLGHEEL